MLSTAELSVAEVVAVSGKAASAGVDAAKALWMIHVSNVETKRLRSRRGSAVLLSL